jgi:hypothetical protein
MQRHPRSRPDLRVICFYGLAGTGKTRFVHSKVPRDNLYVVSYSTLRWFDGYVSQDCCLIDDYRGNGDSALLLRLLDVHPLRVDVKGCSPVPWNPTTIYITSNIAPEAWHSQETAYAEALLRRISACVYFDIALPEDQFAPGSRFDGYVDGINRESGSSNVIPLSQILAEPAQS